MIVQGTLDANHTRTTVTVSAEQPPGGRAGGPSGFAALRRPGLLMSRSVLMQLSEVTVTRAGETRLTFRLATPLSANRDQLES